jgi:putative transposase
LEYKARWDGIPVFYVPAWGTSTKCSICGNKTIELPNEHRTLYCQKCNLKFDRDENAARNILAKGLLRFNSDGSSGEAMKRNPLMRTVIRGADGGKNLAPEAS